MNIHQILGIKFFGGSSREAVEEISRTGGLLSAPAAPSLIALCQDADYREALLGADMTIADSGFMVLLWRLFTGEKVPRISGLEHVKRLLEHESVRETGAVLWVVATERSREKLVEFLDGSGAVGSASRVPGSTEARPADLPFQRLSVSASQHFPTVYVAPKYARPVADAALLALVQQKRPRHIVIAVGGGNQDKLGRYLLQGLDYRPAVHCIGAAIGFLTGDQVRIPDWADKYYLGWFFRSLAQPKVFVPRFWSARRLPWLIARYRDRLPPLEKNVS